MRGMALRVAWAWAWGVRAGAGVGVEREVTRSGNSKLERCENKREDTSEKKLKRNLKSKR